MINNLKVILLFLVTLVLLRSSSCDKIYGGYKYEVGSLPTSPVPLSDFNTEYDDYNSTAPTLGNLIPFCFSTNRKSLGNDFDIIYMPMNVNFDKSTGILDVLNEYGNWHSLSSDYYVIDDGLSKIKSSGNEFGPNLLADYGTDRYWFTLLYSSDVTGNSQIKYISNKTEQYFTDPKDVEFLNSEFDDMYPSFNIDRSKIYFCSNRSGSWFNIYNVDVDPYRDIEELLSDTVSYQINNDAFLSSDSDDKCPFIYENTLVFTSNRDGGYGGFDLYYSRFENGNWSVPVNFGPEINTEYDEYRPILINEGVSYEQTMMVFSSDRPGGKGGFDLYFVGVSNGLVLSDE
jgi:hypothetical protein